MCEGVRICFIVNKVLSAVREDSSSSFYQALPRLATSIEDVRIDTSQRAND